MVAVGQEGHLIGRTGDFRQRFAAGRAEHLHRSLGIGDGQSRAVVAHRDRGDRPPTRPSATSAGLPSCGGKAAATRCSAGLPGTGPRRLRRSRGRRPPRPVRPRGSGSCTARGGPSAPPLPRFLRCWVSFSLAATSWAFFSPKARLDCRCCTATAEIPSTATSAAATTVEVSV